MQYVLKNQASSITSRTEQTLFAQSHSFAPPNGRLIKFQMASAAEWCQLDTVKFVCELQNLNQLEGGGGRASPLELLGPPAIIVQELRILVNGVVVQQIQDFGRTVATPNASTPSTTEIMNGMEALEREDPLRAAGTPWTRRAPASAPSGAAPARADREPRLRIATAPT